MAHFFAALLALVQAAAPAAPALDARWAVAFASPPAATPGFDATTAYIPLKGGELVAKFELPGVDKEHVEVVREDGHLVVRAETSKEEDVEEDGYHRRERFHGRFERAIPLPTEVQDEEIKAKFENGILEVRAPKREPEPSGRKIAVE